MCFRYTFEQNTFGRYCAILMLEMIGGFSILTCVSSTGSFFVSMCIYLMAFVQSCEVHINDINQIASEKLFNLMEFKTKLTQIIQYHNEIYE